MNVQNIKNYELRIRDYKKRGHIVPSKDIIKTKEQIEGIRESGKVNIEVLDFVSEKLCIGMSTEEIDFLVSSKTKDLGGISAQLGYNLFPKSVCTSINNQVCHGIPSKNDFLRDGDIINIDVSTIYNGFYSDSSRTFCIGNVDGEKSRLVKTARESMMEGLKHVIPWEFLGDVGNAVYKYAVKNGYTVVKEFGGHGVGLSFHEEPFVSFISRPKTGMLMVPGMVFTIEPMINMGSRYIYIDKINGWTAYTLDGKPSAQWEMTVAVTENGYEILAY